MTETRQMAARHLGRTLLSVSMVIAGLAGPGCDGCGRTSTVVEVWVTDAADNSVEGARVSLSCHAYTPVVTSCPEIDPEPQTTDEGGLCRFEFEMNEPALLHFDASKGNELDSAMSPVEPGATHRHMLVLRPGPSSP